MFRLSAGFGMATSFSARSAALGALPVGRSAHYLSRLLIHPGSAVSVCNFHQVSRSFGSSFHGGFSGEFFPSRSSIGKQISSSSFASKIITSRAFSISTVSGASSSPMKAVNLNEKEGQNNKKSALYTKIKNVIVLFLLICFPLLCFNLGNWQYRRLGWKNDLITKLNDRMELPPMGIADITLPTNKEDIVQLEDDLEFRRFTLDGKFIHEKEFFVGPRLLDGGDVKIYYVYTPFVITTEGKNKGKQIIVERGYISENFVDPSERLFNSKLTDLSVPMKPVRIVCCLRRKVIPSEYMSVENDKDIRLLAYNDVQDMADRSGSVPIYFQQMIDYTDTMIKSIPDDNNSAKSTSTSSPWFSFFNSKNQSEEIPATGSEIQEFTKQQLVRNGVPIGKHPDITIRNNHLEYLLTWYSLAFISTILIFFVVRKKKVDPLAAKLKHARKFQ